MYTIFSCTKDFNSLFGIIQRNAINSWLKLSPKPNIILFGIEDESIKKEFKDKNITFLPIKDCNEYGTPFVNKIFESAIKNSSTDALCYVNSDIILFNNFPKTIKNLITQKKYFGVGRRHNVEIQEILDFNNQEQIYNYYLSNSNLDSYTGSDYFIFNKYTIKNIPSFLIGRTCWDNWLMYYAATNKLNLTDCSNSIKCIHQKHDYSHIKTNKDNHYKGIEREYNFKQLGGIDKIYDVRDCDFLFENDIVKKNYSIKSILVRFLRKSKILLLKEKLHIKITSIKKFYLKYFYKSHKI